MNVPDDRRYTTEHEWALDEGGGRVKIGITDYAQDALGDVVYVELPEVGRAVEPGATVAEVESTKSVAEVYAPMAGSIVEVNPALATRPELVNTDPYGEGWFFVMQVAEGIDLGELLDAAAYRSHIA